MRKLLMAYIYAQIVFAVLTILFGISYSIRCIAEGTDIFPVILFAAIAVVGYRFMYRASMEELKKERGKATSNRHRD